MHSFHVFIIQFIFADVNGFWIFYCSLECKNIAKIVLCVIISQKIKKADPLPCGGGSAVIIRNRSAYA